MKVNYKFSSTLVSKWLPKTKQGIDAGVLQMATDIHRRSAIAAPKDSRALVNSGKIERVTSGHYKVQYGGGGIRYARRRHFENKKNPQTIGYLEKAGESVTRGNVYKYFKGL